MIRAMLWLWVGCTPTATPPDGEDSAADTETAADTEETGEPDDTGSDTGSDTGVETDTGSDTGLETDTGESDVDTGDTGLGAVEVVSVEIQPDEGVVNTSTLRCEATILPSTVGLDVQVAWSNETTSTDLGQDEELTLDPTLALPGDEIVCEVTASDGVVGDSGDARVTVENRSPVVTTPTLSPQPVFNDSTLTCAATASDPDGTTPTLTYAWSNETRGAPLGTGASLTLGAGLASPGDVVRCTATASDGALTASDLVEATVARRSPVVTTPEIAPSTGVFNDSSLTCSATASDPDGVSTPTLTYAWSNETQATALGQGPTLDLSATSALPGDTIRCTATASGGTLSTSELAETQVGNRTPEIGTPTLDPSTDVFNTSTLTCAATASDPDGTTPTLTYAWRNETRSTALGSGPSVTLTTGDASPGDIVRCTATASDGALTASEVVDVTVGNRAPQIGTLEVQPDDVVFDDGTLTCAATATDPDGTTPTLTYAWSNETEATELGSGASLTLTPAVAAPGDTIRCTATASDGALTDEAFAEVEVVHKPGDGVTSANLGTVRFIPAGAFVMGCEEPRDVDVEAGVSTCAVRSAELPTRTVTLSTPLWMMETEMTQGMWTGLGFVNPSDFAGADRPVEQVTWWEALEAANEASRRDDLPECYTLTGCNSNAVGANRTCAGVSITAPSGHPKDCAGWRLPTEAEWEHAARAGDSTPYAGGASAEEVAWHSRNNTPSGTKAVCSAPVPRNAWGLCDMSGNVWEVTADLFADDYTGAGTLDPVGPSSGSFRVRRGGHWSAGPVEVRIAHRLWVPATARDYNLGFRLVRSAH